FERPAGGVLCAGGVAAEDQRLDRADRPPPAPGRRVAPALAVALGGPSEPDTRFLGSPAHQRGKPRRAGRVPHSSELPLTRVRILDRADAPLAVPVACLGAIED